MVAVFNEDYHLNELNQESLVRNQQTGDEISSVYQDLNECGLFLNNHFRQLSLWRLTVGIAL